jgi:hypothetical protein
MSNVNAARGSPPRDLFFENLKGWMRPQEVALTFGISVLTVYSWKAKAKTRKVPEGLFVKFNRQLYVRRDVLQAWISSQNDDFYKF